MEDSTIVRESINLSMVKENPFRQPMLLEPRREVETSSAVPMEGIYYMDPIEQRAVNVGLLDTYILPEVKIDIDVSVSQIKNDELFFSIDGLTDDMADHVSRSTTITRNDVGDKRMYRITDKDLKTIVHDMVGYVICITASDIPMGVNHRMNDESDRMTPDYYTNQNGMHCYHELKTRRSTNIGSLEIVGDEAIRKYKRALEARRDSFGATFGLFVTVVGPENVVSNCHYNEKHLRSFAITRSIGVAIFAAFVEKGWKSATPDDCSQKISDITIELLKLSSIRVMDNPDPLDITGEHVVKWRKKVTIEEEREMTQNLNKFSKSKVDDLTRPINNNKLVEDFEKSIDFDAESSVPIDKRYTKDNRRKDMKFVVPFPMVVLDHGVTLEREDYVKMIHIDSECTMSRLWSSACYNRISKDQGGFLDYSMEEMLKISAGEIIPDPCDKKVFRRVNVDLSMNDTCDMRKWGVDSKKYDSTPQMVNKEFSSKAPFSYSVHTNDVDNFIDHRTLDKSPIATTCFYSKIKPLLEEGLKGTIPNDTLDSFVDRFMCSKMAHCLDFINEVVEEVNFSRMKNCKEGQFVFSEMRNYPAAILIKPTKADRQIMFSILIKKKNINELFPGPFRKLLSVNSEFCCTEFSTLTTHKITHYLYSTSKCLALLATLHQLFGTLYCKESTDQILRHFNFAVLVHLEDKQQTSEALLLIRYATMELCKGGQLPLNPFKILSKFDIRPKSRLLVWIYKRFIDSTKIMLERNPELDCDASEADYSSEEQSEKSRDLFKNLISWVDRSSIKKFEIALNLCYLGVLHNKDEGDLNHGYQQIFTKVISQEVLMRNIRIDNCGNKTPEYEDIRTHEFDYKFVALISQKAKIKIKQKARDIGLTLEEMILKDLSKKEYEYFATTKSSAKQDKVNAVDEGYDPNDKEPHREKCIIEVLKLLDTIVESGTSPFDKLSQLYSIQQSFGIRCNLFKKNQLGGYREIFVLNMISRMLVSYLEICSRTLCTLMDNEMLTKGSGKLKRTEQHYAKVNNIIKDLKEKTGDNYFTLTTSNSDDAKTWAQQFIMPVFGCMLSNLLPTSMVGAAMNFLNLMTHKKLELPSSLLSNMVKNKDILGFSDELNTLKQQFLGKDDRNDIIETSSRFLKNRSNMMQGILHYTSSLLHSIYLDFYEDYCQRLFKGTLGLVSVVTTKVSSDDSSDTKTIIIKQKHKNCRKLMRDVQKMLIYTVGFKDAGYYLMCIRTSVEKSTRLAKNKIEEFNSQWTIGNTLLSVIIKFAYASVRVMFYQKIEDRMHNMSSLRAQMLENGCCFNLISIIQRCQAIAHYRSMGLNIHPLAGEYINDVLVRPHPNFGMFIFEPDSVCGVFGVGFAWYLRYFSDDRFKREHDLQFKNYGYGMTGSGNIFSKIYLSIAHSRNYFKAVESIGANSIELNNYFMDKPEEYFNPTSRLSVSNKLKVAMLNPAIADSFAFNTDAKLHAFSCYSLHAASYRSRDDEEVNTAKRTAAMAREAPHTLSRLKRVEAKCDLSSSTKFLKGKKSGSNRKKKRDDKTNNSGGKGVSLLSMLKDVKVHEFIHQKEIVTLSELFPLHHQFEQARCLVGLNKFSPTLCRKRRFLRVKLTRITDVAPMTLKETCLSKWTGLQVNHTKYNKNTSIKMYEAMYPWLKETAELTISDDDCPFKDAISLFNFISSQSTHGKKVSLLCQARNKSTSIGTIAEAVKFNQFPSTMVVDNIDYGNIMTSDAQTTVVSDLQNKLWLTKFGPTKPEDRNIAIRTILKGSTTLLPRGLPERKAALDIMNRLTATLSLAQLAVKEGGEIQDFILLLNAAKRGTLASFTERQTVCKNDDGEIEYRGRGTLTVKINSVCLRMFLKDNVLEEIEVERHESLDQFKVEIAEIMANMKLVFDSKETTFSRKTGQLFFNNMGVSTIWVRRGCRVNQAAMGDFTADIMDFRVMMSIGGAVRVEAQILDRLDNGDILMTNGEYNGTDWITVISSSLYPSRTLGDLKIFKDDSKFEHISEIESDWINYRECINTGALVDFILSDHTNVDFVRESLRAKLEYRKLLPSDNTCLMPLAMVAESLVEDYTNDFYDDEYAELHNEDQIEVEPKSSVFNIEATLAGMTNAIFDLCGDSDSDLDSRSDGTSLDLDGDPLGFLNDTLEEDSSNGDAAGFFGDTDIENILMFAPMDITNRTVPVDSPFPTHPFWNAFIVTMTENRPNFFGDLGRKSVVVEGLESLQQRLRDILKIKDEAIESTSSFSDILKAVKKHDDKKKVEDRAAMRSMRKNMNES